MRKICIVIGSRANYTSIKSVMHAVQKHPELTLQVVAGASALLDRYGAVADIIEHDGFTIDERVHMLVEGETPETMAQSAGLGLLSLPSVLRRLRPDIVLTVGDRFETISTAIAATYMNIPLAHTMGGEVTGTIDESIRHAVTKFAHIHFPANQHAADRIIRMGEDPAAVHVVGCPRMDLVLEMVNGSGLQDAFLQNEGVGDAIDFGKPYLLLMQHPVTTEYGHDRDHMMETLRAVHALKMQTIVMWPNADAGSDDIARSIRSFREHEELPGFRFYKNLPPEVFIPLLKRAACMIGNSSAAIREGALLGVPAVNVGTRQSGREHGANVIAAQYDRDQIRAAIEQQLAHGPYASEPLYGDGRAGERIADVLSRCPLTIQKRLTY